MPRGTELEEPCSWGPHQAHFTDGEREALRRGEAFLAPSANEKQRQQQINTVGSFWEADAIRPPPETTLVSRGPMGRTGSSEMLAAVSSLARAR